MFDVILTPENISVIAAGLLSVVFDWFPKVSTWFDTLTSLQKREVMLASLLLVISAAFGLGCAGIVSIACTKISVVNLVWVFLNAAGVNQGVHLLTKPSSKG